MQCDHSISISIIVITQKNLISVRIVQVQFLKSGLCLNMINPYHHFWNQYFWSFGTKFQIIGVYVLPNKILRNSCQVLEGDDFRKRPKNSKLISHLFFWHHYVALLTSKNMQFVCFFNLGSFLENDNFKLYLFCSWN